MNAIMYTSLVQGERVINSETFLAGRGGSESMSRQMIDQKLCSALDEPVQLHVYDKFVDLASGFRCERDIVTVSWASSLPYSQ